MLQIPFGVDFYAARLVSKPHGVPYACDVLTNCLKIVYMG
jgi:hypothetical protein